MFSRAVPRTARRTKEQPASRESRLARCSRRRRYAKAHSALRRANGLDDEHEERRDVYSLEECGDMEGQWRDAAMDVFAILRFLARTKIVMVQQRAPRSLSSPVCAYLITD